MVNLFLNEKPSKLNFIALGIVLSYLLLGSVWILFSDSLFNWLLADTDLFTSYKHYKRWANIFITALLLYFLVRKTLQLIKTQNSLNAGADHWKYVLEGPGDGVWDWDLQTNQIYRSARWKEIFGYAEHEIGTSIDEVTKLIHPEDLKQARYDIKQFVKGKTGVLISEFRLLCKDGSWKWVLSRGMLFTACPGGKPIRMIGTHTDISARKLSEEKYFHLAHYDQITQLPNRILFLDRFALDIKRAQRTDQSITLLYLDLDKFKEVNDTLGHDMGNLLLKETGERLSGCVRVIDTVARVGGDEFTIILNNLDNLFTAERIAQEILSKLAEPFQLGNEMV